MCFLANAPLVLTAVTIGRDRARLRVTLTHVNVRNSGCMCHYKSLFSDPGPGDRRPCSKHITTSLLGFIPSEHERSCLKQIAFSITKAEKLTNISNSSSGHHLATQVPFKIRRSTRKSMSPVGNDSEKVSISHLQKKTVFYFMLTTLAPPK